MSKDKDLAHKKTNRIIKASEKNFIKAYSENYKHLKAEVLEIISKINIKNGLSIKEIVLEINKYNRFDSLLNTIAASIFEMNSESVFQMRNSLKEIYMLNYNQTALEMEKVTGHNFEAAKALEANDESMGSPFTQISIDKAKNKSYIKTQMKSNLLHAFLAGGVASTILAAVRESVNHNLQSSLQRIATEATRVENVARQVVYDYVTENTDYVVIKIWRTQGDNRVRDRHARAEGQSVESNMPFVVNGEELDYPGDARGSPENIINCRCFMESKIVKKRGK